MAIIGIDLGTTNSLAAVWRNEQVEIIPNAHGDVLTPSVMSLDDNDQVIVGRPAKDRLVTHPDHSTACFKRLMGSDKKVVVNRRAFSPEELSALVLRQLKQDAEIYLGEPVEEAVISVPAYFNDNQRNATKVAAQSN
jgi:molecular chaperone HscC